MLIAATVSVLTLLAYASLRNLWMLYAIAFFSGFAVAGTTILPAQTLVINWFDKFRGRAMGLTMLGIGAGGFLLPPFNEFMIRLVGWRMAWVVAAAMLVGIVVPLIVIFVRTWPSELGLLVDGANAGDLSDSASAPPVTGLSVKSAVATSAFWLLLTIFVLQLIGVSAMNFHFVPFAIQELGFDPKEAAFYYGLTVGFSIAGRLLFGWLADRWPPALLLALSFALLALGPTLIELLLFRLELRDVRLLWLPAGGAVRQRRGSRDRAADGRRHPGRPGHVDDRQSVRRTRSLREVRIQPGTRISRARAGAGSRCRGVIK